MFCSRPIRLDRDAWALVGAWVTVPQSFLLPTQRHGLAVPSLPAFNGAVLTVLAGPFMDRACLHADLTPILSVVVPWARSLGQAFLCGSKLRYRDDLPEEDAGLCVVSFRWWSWVSRPADASEQTLGKTSV